MQNYFSETWRGEAVSMKTREEGSGRREGKRGKGVTWAGRMVNNKVSGKVTCGLWRGGRARTRVILGGRTTSDGWNAGADPLRWPGAAILSRHQRALALVSGIFVHAVHLHLLYMTQLQTFRGFADLLPSKLPSLDLPFCWVPSNDARRHALSQTNKMDASDGTILADGRAKGHSDFYFLTPSLFVKL